MDLWNDAFILSYFHLIIITKSSQKYDGNRVAGISLALVE